MALNKELEICQKISSEVKNTFLKLYNAVKERETQLLRQIEVLAQHCRINNSYEKCFKHITVGFENEMDILLSVSNFGQINFNGLAHDSNFLKIEDYQHPDKDHVQLFKCVSNDNEPQHISKNVKDLKIKIPTETSFDIDEKPEKIENEEPVSEPRVTNVILECIEKQDPSLCIYKVSNQLEEALNEEEHFSSCCSSPNETQKTSKYCDTINNLSQDTLDKISCISSSNSESNLNCSCSTNSPSTTNCPSKECNPKESISTNSAEELCNVSDSLKKLSMKQPVQVQQWMKQIISEPEIEPGPNNMMEHSQIKIFHEKIS